MRLNLLLLLAALVNAATAAEAPVGLGTACNYVILAKTGISTVPTSAITGNIAVSPIAATAMTGFGLVLDLGGQYSTASQFTGKAYGASYGGGTAADLTVAVGDMGIAYTDASSRLNANATRINPGGGDISGMTMTPGVYTFQVGIGINTDVYFDAFGDSTAVFIIQTTGNILQAMNTKVILQGGARAENIFWQVAGNVAIGVGAHFAGIILCFTDVSFLTGASLDGLILAQTACVLQMATITQAVGTCGISTAPPVDEGGQASAMATITVIATTIDLETLISTTTSTTITKTTVVTALETTKTTNTTLATTTTANGGTPVTVTDQQEPIVEVSLGSGEEEPEALATVSAVEGTAPFGATATATATAIALGSFTRSASATAEATSTCGPASTASATATTTAMRTTTSAISSADSSNTDLATPPITKSEIMGTDTAVAQAVATETATSSATSTFAEADEQ
jgi:hypothetical protein